MTHDLYEILDARQPNHEFGYIRWYSISHCYFPPRRLEIWTKFYDKLLLSILKTLEVKWLDTENDAHSTILLNIIVIESNSTVYSTNKKDLMKNFPLFTNNNLRNVNFIIPKTKSLQRWNYLAYPKYRKKTNVNIAKVAQTIPHYWIDIHFTKWN